MDDERMAALRRLETTLRSCQESDALRLVTRASEASAEELEQFLVSNELWGGAGSIADQAGMPAGLRTPCKRLIEEALIQLGEAQLAAGRVNVRTALWVSVFKTWKDQAI